MFNEDALRNKLKSIDGRDYGACQSLKSEYDFSEEKLRDSLGNLPPKRPLEEHTKTGASRSHKNQRYQINTINPMVGLVPLLG